MTYRVGDTVVYPHHGAATIVEVKKRIIKGEEKLYLKLNVTQGDLVIEGPWGEMGAWLPALPIVHLGKATSFGFGRVEWSTT
jgi:hypothetical protein